MSVPIHRSNQRRRGASLPAARSVCERHRLAHLTQSGFNLFYRCVDCGSTFRVDWSSELASSTYEEIHAANAERLNGDVVITNVAWHVPLSVLRHEVDQQRRVAEWEARTMHVSIDPPTNALNWYLQGIMTLGEARAVLGFQVVPAREDSHIWQYYVRATRSENIIQRRSKPIPEPVHVKNQLPDHRDAIPIGWRVLLDEAHRYARQQDVGYTVTSVVERDGELQILLQPSDHLSRVIRDGAETSAYSQAWTALNCCVADIEYRSGETCRVCGERGRKRQVNERTVTTCGKMACREPSSV